MKVVGLNLIDDFCRVNRRARRSVDHWIENVRRAEWKSLMEIRKTFRHCDKVGSCYVFNIGGNHYRLIAKINFPASVVVVRSLLTHSDYDSEKWKRHCD